MSYFKDEADDFWDVSKLVPHKRASAKPFSTGEKIAEVVLGDKTNELNKHDGEKLDFSLYKAQFDNAGKAVRTYSPVWSKLISKVTIKPSIDRFDFYGTFRKAALIYFDYKCPKCDFVPFYSYMPQYVQMTTEQKKYYFYWRDEVRHGRYPKTDYSYISLYVYEILNLPEKIDSREGIKLLCALWRAYRGQLPAMDNKFALLIQDYCLIYELECPSDDIRDFLIDVIGVCIFKEFYLSDIGGTENCASSMIAYLSDYDWRRGKYASGSNSDAYRRHVEGAMSGIFLHLFKEDHISRSEISTLSRTAFRGCLCTHSVKCNLEIEYYSIADSPKMRADVTAALKYVENKLRSSLGVKSRLTVRDLPDEFKNIIDRYFELEFEKKRRQIEKANAPEYERLYDSSETSVSFESAIEIERASWKTTARLIEGLEDSEDSEHTVYTCSDGIEKPDVPESDGAAKDARNDRYGLSSESLEFLIAALDSDTERMAQIAARKAVTQDIIADGINEAFFDNFGDVVLEVDEHGTFKIIDDYYEEIKEWIQ